MLRSLAALMMTSSVMAGDDPCDMFTNTSLSSSEQMELYRAEKYTQYPGWVQMGLFALPPYSTIKDFMDLDPALLNSTLTSQAAWEQCIDDCIANPTVAAPASCGGYPCGTSEAYVKSAGCQKAYSLDSVESHAAKCVSGPLPADWECNKPSKRQELECPKYQTLEGYTSWANGEFGMFQMMGIPVTPSQQATLVAHMTKVCLEDRDKYALSFAEVNALIPGLGDTLTRGIVMMMIEYMSDGGRRLEAGSMHIPEKFRELATPIVRAHAHSHKRKLSSEKEMMMAFMMALMSLDLTAAPSTWMLDFGMGPAPALYVFGLSCVQAAGGGMPGMDMASWNGMYDSSCVPGRTCQIKAFACDGVATDTSCDGQQTESSTYCPAKPLFYADTATCASTKAFYTERSCCAA